PRRRRPSRKGQHCKRASPDRPLQRPGRRKRGTQAVPRLTSSGRGTDTSERPCRQFSKPTGATAHSLSRRTYAVPFEFSVTTCRPSVVNSTRCATRLPGCHEPARDEALCQIRRRETLPRLFNVAAHVGHVRGRQQVAAFETIEKC